MQQIGTCLIYNKWQRNVEKVKKQRQTAGGNVTATTGHRNSRRQPQEYLILPSLRHQRQAGAGAVGKVKNLQKRQKRKKPSKNIKKRKKRKNVKKHRATSKYLRFK